MPSRRRHHRTALEIPADHGVRYQRSSTTQLGYQSLIEPEPEPTPEPESEASQAGPWTEQVYVSPSGRIFLPPGFDFEQGRPRTVTLRSLRRQPPAPRPAHRRANVVLGEVASRTRAVTRESWVVPSHLAPA